MAKCRLEDLADMDLFITAFRQDPFKYGWGTTKNYLAVIGKFGDFCYSTRVFEPPEGWFEKFKVAYHNAISACKYHMREETSMRAREVLIYLNYSNFLSFLFQNGIIN